MRKGARTAWALVHKVFKMAAQSVGNVGNVVVLRKGFFETLEDGTSVKRERKGPRGCRLFSFA